MPVKAFIPSIFDFNTAKAIIKSYFTLKYPYTIIGIFKEENTFT